MAKVALIFNEKPHECSNQEFIIKLDYSYFEKILKGYKIHEQHVKSYLTESEFDQAVSILRSSLQKSKALKMAQLK